MKIFTLLKQKFQFSQHKNIIIGFIMGISFLLLPSYAFAADPVTNVNGVTAEGLSLLMKFVVVVIGLISQFIGYFLSAGWITGADIGILPKLKDLWVFVSNVVYFVFALIFVAIAILNIMGKDDYAFKSAIPRFIVGVLIVPFSWFIVQFVVSISAILAASVITIPFDTFPTLKSDMDKQFQERCVDFRIMMKKENGKEERSVECKERSNAKTANDKPNLYGVLNVYTYGILKVDQALFVSGNATDIVTDLVSLVGKLGFSLFFIVVYGLLLIALFLALVVRGIMLWVFMIFSPVFGLLHFFKKSGSGLGDGALKTLNFTEFIGLAMVPVYVSAALSFGLLFVFITAKGISESAIGNNDGKYFKIQKVGTGTTMVTSGDTKITTNMLTDSQSTRKATQNQLGTQAVGSGVVLFFAQLMSVGVLWIAVMAALSQSKITESVVKPIADFGNQIGGIVKQLPTHAPIIPTPQGRLSANGLKAAGNSFSNAVGNLGSDKGAELGKSIAEGLGIKTNEISEKLQKLLRNNNTGPTTPEGKNELVQNTLIALETPDKIDTKVSAQALELLQKVGLTDDGVKAMQGKTRDQFVKQLSAISQSGNEKLWGGTIPTVLRQKTPDQIKDVIKGDTSEQKTPVSPEKEKAQNLIQSVGPINGHPAIKVGEGTFTIENNKITNPTELVKSAQQAGIGIDQLKTRLKEINDKIDLSDIK